MQSSRKVRPSTTSHYKARTKYFPGLLRTTKLAQSTSQYYFVLQSSHKELATKYFPVLRSSAKLAQSTSQDYFLLQSSHKVRPSTTSYYIARTKYVPVLLRTTKLATKYVPVLFCITKLAQSTYFVVQSLLTIEPHFVRKGCDRRRELAI